MLDLLFVGAEATSSRLGRGLGGPEKMLEVLACVEPCTQRSVQRPFIGNVISRHKFTEWLHLRPSSVGRRASGIHTASRKSAYAGACCRPRRGLGESNGRDAGGNVHIVELER